jgi:hypothetical protein
MVIVTMTPSRDVPQSDYPKSGSRQQVHLHQIGDSALITLAIFVERIAVVSAIHPSITKRSLKLDYTAQVLVVTHPGV